VENFALVPFNFGKPEVEMYYCNLMSVVKGSWHNPEDELAHVDRKFIIRQKFTRGMIGLTSEC
jgi:hypothetical protein